jgi:hypothetical protein
MVYSPSVVAREFFVGSTLPDVELIVKIAALNYTERSSLPLFLTVLRATESPAPFMRLSPGNLEYTGPLVTWLGV